MCCCCCRCCCDVCRRGTCGLRCGVFWCVLVALASAGLMTAGVAVLGSYNPRAASVAEYNSKGQMYTSDVYDAFSMMSFTLVPSSFPAATALMTRSPVPLSGDTSDIMAFTSRVFEFAAVPRAALNDEATMVPLGPPGSSAFTPFNASVFGELPPVMSRVVGLYCTPMECASSHGGEDCVCSRAVMVSKCVTSFNGTYEVPEGDEDSCRVGSKQPCGPCVYTAYLTAVCVVVAFDPRIFSVVPSPTYRTCEFPFTNSVGRYESARRDAGDAVTVRIMADADPFIDAQRLTEGTMDFGWPVRDQHIVGSALLASGALALVGALVCIRWIIRTHRKDVEGGDAAAAAPPVAVVPFAEEEMGPMGAGGVRVEGQPSIVPAAVGPVPHDATTAAPLGSGEGGVVVDHHSRRPDWPTSGAHPTTAYYHHTGYAMAYEHAPVAAPSWGSGAVVMARVIDPSSALPTGAMIPAAAAAAGRQPLPPGSLATPTLFEAPPQGSPFEGREPLAPFGVEHGHPACDVYPSR